MRFQGVISCALFDVSLVQGVLSFYIYKGHYDLATWFTAVGQPTPFAIGWTFLLATNPSLALVRQLHLAFAVAVLVATQVRAGWGPRMAQLPARGYRGDRDALFPAAVRGGHCGRLERRWGGPGARDRRGHGRPFVGP